MSTIEERRLMRLKKADLVKLILTQQQVLNVDKIVINASEQLISEQKNRINKLTNTLSEVVKHRNKLNKKLKKSKKKETDNNVKIEDYISKIKSIRLESSKALEAQQELISLRESELKEACLENLTLSRQYVHLTNNIKGLKSERDKIINFNSIKQQLSVEIINQKIYPKNSQSDSIYEYLSDSRNLKEIEHIFDSVGYKGVKFYEYKIIYTKMKNIRNNLAHATS
jgi:hypothetical protein